MNRWILCLLCGASAMAADKLESLSNYAKRYGDTKGVVSVDPAKDLPRYSAVPPQKAVATWQVKKGFRMELVAHEPQVCSPIALCFDERGRMFVCEMIDYSERRDVTPHLGRVSMLEDLNADGHFETSKVFADDLPWPTGLIWAGGGLYVISTPDIWFFKDADNDGKAEVREKVFTGFGTGLKLLNVQGLANSPQWGLDNRIHILAGGGNRGVVTCLKRPDLKGIELGGKDFWFDPRTLEFGLEGGGAQYGMSFDNEGRKFGCSNSDHLQHWIYDDRYASRSPWSSLPPARQSIAVDGGAAEVFRISPDEPWRIIRTRWRVAGVVKGVVEGGGRVSGYFTGASGTTIYRGDAYGTDFVGNSFTGDAGGQLVHRKRIKPSTDGMTLIGERPEDERGYEFAASMDTWVRVVNFANAPDGCLYVIDMYREVIEHPWSIPDEIKRHINLNSGHDMGRIYRVVPESGAKRIGQKVDLASATGNELVSLLSHRNGWHRDTAQRLLYERQDQSAIQALGELLERPVADGNDFAKLHALGALEGFGKLSAQQVTAGIRDTSPAVKIRGIRLAENFISGEGLLNAEVESELLKVSTEALPPRVLLQLALTLSQIRQPRKEVRQSGRPDAIDRALLEIISKTQAHPLLAAASFSGVHDSTGMFEELLNKARIEAQFIPVVQMALQVIGHKNDSSQVQQTLQTLLGEAVSRTQLPHLIQSLAVGLKQGGGNLEAMDSSGRLKQIFSEAAALLRDTKAAPAQRLEALRLCALARGTDADEALHSCLAKGQPDDLQTAVVRILGQRASDTATKVMLQSWPSLGSSARSEMLEAMQARDERALALLQAMRDGGEAAPKPGDLSATQVQALVEHKKAAVATLAKTVLAPVIPPSRQQVVAAFQPALTLPGSSEKGALHYQTRCLACHVAGGMGMPVGPDLVTMKNKGKEGLLSAILEPHKEVAPQFIAYTVNTKDGQTVSGIVTKDDASSMTLKMMGGAEVHLLRADIRGSSSTGQSLMPEGLETGMSPQDMADLLAYLEALK